MTSKTLIGLATATVILAGCATPPGQLQESDFVSQSSEIERTVSETSSTFYEGLRYCGPETYRGIFALHNGVPECSPPRPDGTMVCDMYIKAPYGGRSDWVLGRVDFAPSSTGTLVTFRVQTWVARNQQIIAAWKKFAAGQAREVCSG